ncbi:MAG: hypothetical protein H7A38_01280 [Chlamydiales bacterium]|nr:hypothetical protein [Chlamydiales bacterium]
MKKGVMTGCNQTNENHLQSWLEHYSKHNSFPVTFCDFGMSESGRAFCEKNGTVLKATGKASALPLSPYDETIWTDINCEVNASLAPLFEMAQVKDGFAISYSKENRPRSGVMAFTKNSPVIVNWHAWCIKNKEVPDDKILELLLKENNFQLTQFSEKYYWIGVQKAPAHIAISLAS